MAREQISQGKARDRRSIYPPHIRPAGPDDIGLRVFVPSRPPARRLVCGSCSSGRSFACGFLPTAHYCTAVAIRLGVPVIEIPRGLAPPSHFPNRFRYRLSAPDHGAARHAWRTQKKGLVRDEPFVSHQTFLSGHKPAEQQASGRTVTKQPRDQVPVLVELRFRPDNRHYAIGQREVEKRIDLRV